MSEWWTYTLSDFLMFAPRTYYRLFELYNLEVWPAQILALALGFAILALPFRPVPWQGRAAAAIVAGGWLWIAWAFHYERYATINWAANYFALGFALQAAVLGWSGLVRDRLRLRPTVPGLAVFAFALVPQPLLGLAVGRSWAQVEIFGLAPDPTAVATLGIVLLTSGRVAWELLPIPLAWCAIGGATLWTMDAPDAPVLPAVGILVGSLLVRRASRA